MTEYMDPVGRRAIVNNAVSRITYYNDTPGVDWMEWTIENAGSTQQLQGHISQNRVEEYHDGRESEAESLDATVEDVHGVANGSGLSFVQQTDVDPEATATTTAKDRLAKARAAKEAKRRAREEQAAIEEAVATDAATPKSGKTAAEAGVLEGAVGSGDGAGTVTEVARWPEGTAH